MSTESRGAHGRIPQGRSEGARRGCGGGEPGWPIGWRAAACEDADPGLADPRPGACGWLRARSRQAVALLPAWKVSFWRPLPSPAKGRPGSAHAHPVWLSGRVAPRHRPSSRAEMGACAAAPARMAALGCGGRSGRARGLVRGERFARLRRRDGRRRGSRPARRSFVQGRRDQERGVVGGAKRDRTADLLHAMQALSQLSYSPTVNTTWSRR